MVSGLVAPLDLKWGGRSVLLSFPCRISPAPGPCAYLRGTMAKLAKNRPARKATVRKSTPKRPKRALPDVRKFAGAVPGMADWALDEVRRMRDEW